MAFKSQTYRVLIASPQWGRVVTILARHVPAPVPEFGESFRHELRCRLALARARLFHVLILDIFHTNVADLRIQRFEKKSARF